MNVPFMDRTKFLTCNLGGGGVTLRCDLQQVSLHPVQREEQICWYNKDSGRSKQIYRLLDGFHEKYRKNTDFTNYGGNNIEIVKSF